MFQRIFFGVVNFDLDFAGWPQTGSKFRERTGAFVGTIETYEMQKEKLQNVQGGPDIGGRRFTFGAP